MRKTVSESFPLKREKPWRPGDYLPQRSACEPLIEHRPSFLFIGGVACLEYAGEHAFGLPQTAERYGGDITSSYSGDER